MTDTTTIRIEPDVRDRLKERGAKGETYSEIVARLLDATEEGGDGDE